MTSQMMGLSQPGSINANLVQTPQAQVTPANYAQIVADNQKAQMEAYKASVTQQGNMMKGLFGVGATALGGLAGGPAGAAMGARAFA